MPLPRPALALLLRACALAATLPAAARAQPTPAPLRVVRTTPAADASPLARVSVTFDRPVAGSLDRDAVDPAAILRVEPAIPGRVEWRDPSTIRLVPSAPLAPGARYTVTVTNDFRAMDGSRLAGPHRFTFRAEGPRLIGGAPVWKEGGREAHVVPDQRFELVYAAPVDLATLSASAYLEFGAACSGGQRVVRLRAAQQRRLRDEDAPRLREAGGWQRDRALDSLRRVVQLVPERALPRGCAGELVAPEEATAGAPKGYARIGFETYGELRMAAVQCRDGSDAYCPTGPLTITFTNPVRGAEVQRRVRLIPDARVVVRDTSHESTTWTLEARLTPHVGYAVVADTTLRDVFGQRLRGNPALGFRTTGYAPEVEHPYGRLLVERVGFRTLAVQHVNVDTLVATIAPVPQALEARLLGRFGYGDDSLWTTLARGATTQRLAVRAGPDRPAITGVKLPVPDAARPNAPGLFAVRIAGRAGGKEARSDGPTALVQVTDLGVHARVGPTEGHVWVTSVSTGAAVAGAAVELRAADGRRLAAGRTDARGLVRLAGWTRPAADTLDDDGDERIEGFVKVSLGDDRAYAAINRWDPDLAPWRFDVESAWGDERLPLAGALFTERGIYRPGERVYAKAIVRDGSLGALRAPAPGDSLRWRFHDRDEGVLRETTTALSAFGTADRTVDLPRAAAIGEYAVEVQARRQGRWRTVARTTYRVAEYRPPEFLVDLAGVRAGRVPGDTLAATVQARYLFGARMGRAALTWTARRATLPSWELEIPGVEGWHVGESGAWWEEDQTAGVEEFASGTDTLDARGERTLRVALPPIANGRPARVTLVAAVTDVNRQAVGTSTTAIVHPADVYVAARPRGNAWFWRAGTPVTVDLLAVRPTGEKVAGVRVQGTIARREWHSVRRQRGGVAETVGEWVTDTVARCAVTSAATPTPCTFTPTGGGEYTVTFGAADAAGRAASTRFQRWASGTDWVPWNDESQFKMDVIPDRTRYAVGDTATVLFASPFTNAEAWITVEREGVIEQRRVRITAGATTLRFPITEAYAPNAFVSIIVARGRSARPGALDDPGRPTIRVGYAELRVTPEVKRLQVALAPERPEYRPGDSARVSVQVRDAASRGARAEVALWAVDEGVLALTGYQTPDPVELIYRARGLGLRLASNMTAVAPQVPEGEKGRREPGGGGGAAGADVLRSRFQTTAFFLGAVITDAQGNAVATAKLPDNLTTFRVMAVAVTAGDRYGKGEASLLVTRPLLARQALPRFVRPGDVFDAGAVINRRDGAAGNVTVRAAATGVSLRGGAERRATLAASRGAEVRFPFEAPRTAADSATFRFDVGDGRDADAVRVVLPVRPEYHPRAHTIAGVLRDTATVEFTLPSNVDPARSRLSIDVGPSPLATIRGMADALHVYPYYCSEQVISAALPIIALHRARQGAQRGAQVEDIVRAVEMLSRRQRADGGIGYWSATDWSSPWLSAYAGLVLLDARDVGVAVDAGVVARLARYLSARLRGEGEEEMLLTPVADWSRRRENRLREQIASADFLSRLGRPEVAAENELLRMAAQLTIEDRARLAKVLARRRQLAAARRLMEPTWASVRVEGRIAVLPEPAPSDFYFESRARPTASVLQATLAIDPEHALVGPLVEALADHGRAARSTWLWNTQDYASAVAALADFERRQLQQGTRTVTVRSGNRTVLAGATTATAGGAARDSSVALRGLLAPDGGAQSLRLALDAGAGTGVVYYYLTVTEVPNAPPTTAADAGITVERWYEPYEGAAGRRVTSVAEGELVRVRLRITVPSTRHFVVLDDALPAGLEAVDLSLRTTAPAPGPGAAGDDGERREPDDERRWSYGTWDSGWWSPFDHREIRDDRVVYSATVLWAGSYTATYLARATTPGTFVRPPAHAEEMYNPAVNGRSDGGTFTVTPRR